MWRKYCSAGRPRKAIWLMPLHAGYPRAQIHTRVVWYLLYLYCNISCTNAAQYYVKGALFVMFRYVESVKVFGGAKV
jgi:hypothetical protein